MEVIRMKRKAGLFMAMFLLFILVIPAMAQFYGQDQNVRGYTRRDGTYVQPSHRTAQMETDSIIIRLKGI